MQSGMKEKDAPKKYREAFAALRKHEALSAVAKKAGVSEQILAQAWRAYCGGKDAIIDQATRAAEVGKPTAIPSPEARKLLGPFTKRK